MESTNVKIDESSFLKTKKERRNPNILEDQIDIELKQEKEEEDEEEHQDEKQPEGEQENNQQNFQTPCKTPKRWVQKNQPLEHIIGDKSVGMETRRRRQVHTLEQVHFPLLSTVEPSSFEEARNDEH